MFKKTLKRADDRRKVNRAVKVDRRGTKPERRKCPQCKGTLFAKINKVKGGTVTAVVCADCGWKAVSEQVAAHLVKD